MKFLILLVIVIIAYVLLTKENMYPLRCGAPLMYGGAVPTAGVVKLNDSTHDEVVNQPDTYVMVKYYTDWCGYCQKMKGEWDDLASEISNPNLIIAEVNADESPTTVSKYGIKSYPTLKLWSNGKPLDVDVPRTVGDWKQFLASRKIST